MSGRISIAFGLRQCPSAAAAARPRRIEENSAQYYTHPGPGPGTVLHCRIELDHRNTEHIKIYMNDTVDNEEVCKRKTKEGKKIVRVTRSPVVCFIVV